MRATPALPAAIQNLVHVWARPQYTLPKVIRWKKYVRRGSRRQNTLEHSYSIALFALWWFPHLRQYVTLNEELVLKALLVHDIGEGEVGADTLYIDKSHDGDLAECAAFFERFGDAVGEEGREAYLLQFATKADQMPRYRGELQRLAIRYPTEILVFQAIEKFDYVLYALEQFLLRKQVKILVQTLRHQMWFFDRLAEELPGFRATLWTPDFATWCESLLDRHSLKWIEQKGEK